MIINKINDIYIIKIPNNKIDIYNPIELENITKKIIMKLNKNYKLNNKIHIEIFINDNYGTIMKLKDLNSSYNINNNKTVKITIHTDATFLYQIDYFNIHKQKIKKPKVYYYKSKYYLEITNEIKIKDYYQILELSEIIYEDTDVILNKGIKI